MILISNVIKINKIFFFFLNLINFNNKYKKKCFNLKKNNKIIDFVKMNID